MKRKEDMEDRPYIFGTLLTAANRLDKLMDRELAPFGVTAAQWFLTAMTEGLFDGPPTIKELARATGSSHQNVKQVALKMQEKGLVRLIKDAKDARATRIVLTEQSASFWGRTSEAGDRFVEAVFRGMDEAELAAMRDGLYKISANLMEMELRDNRKEEGE